MVDADDRGVDDVDAGLPRGGKDGADALEFGLHSLPER